MDKNMDKKAVREISKHLNVENFFVLLGANITDKEETYGMVNEEGIYRDFQIDEINNEHNFFLFDKLSGEFYKIYRDEDNVLVIDGGNGNIRKFKDCLISKEDMDNVSTFDYEKEKILASPFLSEESKSKLILSPLVDFDFNLESPYMICIGEFIYIAKHTLDRDYWGDIIPNHDFEKIKELFIQYPTLKEVHIPNSAFHIIGFNEANEMNYFIQKNNMDRDIVDDEYENRDCNKTIEYRIIKHHDLIHYDVRENMMLHPLTFVNEESHEEEILLLNTPIHIIEDYKASEDEDEEIYLDNMDEADTTQDFTSKIWNLIKKAKVGKLLTPRVVTYKNINKVLNLITEENLKEGLRIKPLAEGYADEFINFYKENPNIKHVVINSKGKVK